jgi:glycosyltransferase involved in cell wall biosynthesis
MTGPPDPGAPIVVVVAGSHDQVGAASPWPLVADGAGRPPIVVDPVPSSRTVPGRGRWWREAAREIAAGPDADRRTTIVHVLDHRLWWGGWRLARRIDAHVVLHLGDVPADEVLQDRRLRWWLRAAKPVLAVPDEAARQRLPAAVPTVGVRADLDGALEDLGHVARLLRCGGVRFVAVNGRFRTRPTSGVERVAENVGLHLRGPKATLVPRGPWGRGPLGHLWEQLVLPLVVLPYRAVLWSPCNFGPVLRRRQVASVYDVAPLDHPEWFSRGYRTWFRVVVGALHRRAAGIAVPTEFTRARMAERFGPTASTVRVVPGGVGSTDGADRRQPGRAQDVAMPTDEPFVCFVGSLEPRKNLATLVEAMALVRERTACSLVVVGPTASMQVFAQGGVPEDPPPWVHRLGRVDDDHLEQLLRRCACLAYVSRYEGFGLPPLEAMQRGAPVVVADIPPLRETCGDAARFVDPGDAVAIAGAILDLVRLDDAVRGALREAGYRQAARFPWSGAADALEDLLWST